MAKRKTAKESKSTRLRLIIDALIASSDKGLDYETFGLPMSPTHRDFQSVCKDGAIGVHLPGEVDGLTWSIDPFIDEATDFQSVKSEGHGQLCTSSRAVQVVQPANDLAHIASFHHADMRCCTAEGANVYIDHQSLIAGLHAERIGAFESDYSGCVTSHPVVVVDYRGTTTKRTASRDSATIDAYLFELASFHNIVWDRADFFSFDGDWDFDDTTFLTKIGLRPLEEPNDGIRLYVAAMQITDPQLRFFSFFKVLEHFAPLVLNLECYDALRKKLDGPGILSPSHDMLRQLFQLSKSFDARRNDRDLIKMVIGAAIDLVGLNHLVPTHLRKVINHDSTSRELEQYAKELAEALCATRNQVAHAKSTYPPTGAECPPEYLPALTDFTREAAAGAIRWYNRLPTHQRAEAARSLV